MLFLTLSCLAVLTASLAAERTALSRAGKRISLRIAVTGVRGKSSVTRLIAAGLRGAGHRVLAKTTGSKPVLIMPDGREEEIPRRGLPSVREQVRLVSQAARLGADCLVTETMSVRPDNLAVEIGRVIRPGILALTNVRPDHLDALGRDEAAIARSLASAFPRKAVVAVPESELRPEFEAAARRCSSRLVAAPACDPDELTAAGLGAADFPDNVGLALAVLELAGVDRGRALAAMRGCRPDFGGLKAWRVPVGPGGGQALCFSAFAANDPCSSAEAVERIRAAAGSGGRRLLGLLCLRGDRGDRTMQWIEAAGRGFFDGFESTAVLGVPAPAFRRRLMRRSRERAGRFVFVTRPEPALVLESLLAGGEAKGAAFIGLGNIIGLGRAFIEYWETIGEPHGI